ncbi:MAG: nuclear transport factor 2 family protein [Deltaproteobacteria bacterium]|nr:nuclear transport factor 2 family protein [Deltaproteobacteria bacterium]
MSDKCDDVMARLARLEDLEAIRQTWLDYCHRLDSANWTALRDVFTEDAVLEMHGLDHLVKGMDGQYRGRQAIINDFYRRTGAVVSHDAKPMFVTGHIITNMQIALDGDEATTLAYFFEIVANDRVLIGTYQHRVRRDADRWRFRFLRIAIRYRAKLEATDVGGQSLNDILARPV